MLLSDEALAEWLFDTGGPIIRYLTARDLLAHEGAALAPLEAALLESPEVQRWLSNLGAGPIHHSTDTAAENAMAKLTEFGLRRGLPPFDERMLPYCDLAAVSHRDYEPLVLLPFLIRGGYCGQGEVETLFMSRLEALHRTARRGDYDVHLPESDLQGLPKAWRGKPIYRPEFGDGAYPLPSCYDFYALAYAPKDDLESHAMMDAVAAYLSDPRFQSISGGYSWDRDKGRCYAAGRTYLACANPEREVLFLELGARFEACRESDWFLGGMNRLESCRTERGAFRFPPEMLKEKRNSYHLYGGAHMGLGENRRAGQWCEIESTFRMLRLKRLLREA